MSTSDYQIISDSSCDLSLETAKENMVHIVPFYVSFDQENYKKELIDISIRDFYQEMMDRPGVYPKSSLPAIGDFVDAFTTYAKQGKNIICICITTKFSGSYNSACNARDIVLEDYPDIKINIVNSMVNTVLQGLVVLEAVSMQKEGLSFEETTKRLENIKSSGRIFFTIGSMDYLRNGGRIGKLKGIAAEVLGIKPLITLKQGEIFPSGLIRSRTKAHAKLINQVKDYIKTLKVSLKDFSLAVGYGYDIEEGISFRNQLLSELKEEFGFEPHILLSQIGAAIGVHTGPLPIGIGIVLHHDAPETALSAVASLNLQTN